MRAQQLDLEARLTAIFGGFASLAVLVGAFALWRLLLQRERLEQRAARDRQLASLGEMSAVLAHEIRNPLASLKGHAQLLAEALPDDGRPKQKADRIVREAVRLETLSNDLLDFVRSGSIQRESVDPAALARSTAERFDDERIQLVTERAPREWSLDRTRFEQVVTNLLTNALEASPDDQPVTLELARVDGELELTCRDRGEGVPEEERSKIFEPFHTTRTRGTGLGLAVTRRIVELHGGSISVENHPDGGALFRVRVRND